MGVYRAILIAFPNCADDEGVKTLARAQKSLRLTSFLRARMIGVFYADAPEPGLWNKDFRPLRAPIPLVRSVHWSSPTRPSSCATSAYASYLYNFPLAGPRGWRSRRCERLETWLRHCARRF